MGSRDNFIQTPTAGGGSAVATSPSLPTPVTYNTPAISTDELFPSRYMKQAHSGSKKVAYVVFNGLSPGLFYNWQANSFLWLFMSKLMKV